MSPEQLIQEILELYPYKQYSNNPNSAQFILDIAQKNNGDSYAQIFHKLLQENPQTPAPKKYYQLDRSNKNYLNEIFLPILTSFREQNQNDSLEIMLEAILRFKFFVDCTVDIPQPATLNLSAAELATNLFPASTLEAYLYHLIAKLKMPTPLIKAPVESIYLITGLASVEETQLESMLNLHIEDLAIQIIKLCNAASEQFKQKAYMPMTHLNLHLIARLKRAIPYGFVINLSMEPSTNNSPPKLTAVAVATEIKTKAPAPDTKKYLETPWMINENSPEPLLPLYTSSQLAKVIEKLPPADKGLVETLPSNKRAKTTCEFYN